MALDFRARVAQHAGDPQLAVELLSAAVDRQRGCVDDAQLAQCLGRLASVACEAGRQDDAFTAAYEAVAFADGSGSAPAQRDAYMGLGQVHLLLGERERSVAALVQAARVAMAIGEPAWEELAWLARALALGDARASGYLAGAARARLGRTGAVGRRFDEVVEHAEHEANDDAFRTAFETGTSATQADLEALLVELDRPPTHATTDSADA
jgi:tetratricopeptide (TPR) repeat protein